ncbi:MAG: hypothetical protein ACJ741_11365, partial [Pyrinomonadaceae bacterium]
GGRGATTPAVHHANGNGARAASMSKLARRRAARGNRRHAHEAPPPSHEPEQKPCESALILTA